MPCESYREALTDAVAAAAGSAPPLTEELRAHLEACSACRAFLAEEQQLFSAIDSSVRFAANAEVPASLVARVRVGLNEQQVRQHSWFPLGAALASAVLLLTIVFFVRAYERHASESNPKANAVARGGAPAEAAVLPTPLVAPRSQIAPHPGRHRSSQIERAATPDEVRVLIPPGQKQAVDALLIALKTGAVDGNILAVAEGHKPSQDGELSPLSISPIEIQPLAPVSEESAPDTEKTRR